MIYEEYAPEAAVSDYIVGYWRFELQGSDRNVKCGSGRVREWTSLKREMREWTNAGVDESEREMREWTSAGVDEFTP